MSRTDPQRRPPTNLRRTSEETYPPLSDEQAAVFESFRSPGSLTVARAGSGAGKTRLAVECFCDAIWRDLDAGRSEPRGSVFVTFTRTGARDIRDAVEARLADHVAACERAGATDDPIYRNWNEVQAWIEERADVRTLDSLTLEWYRRLARASDLPSDVSAGDSVATEAVFERIETAIRNEAAVDDDLASAIATLEARYGDGEDDAGPTPWLTAVHEAMKVGRQYCEGIEWVISRLREGVDACFGGDRPESAADVASTIRDLSGEYVDPLFVNDAWLQYARATYDATARLVADFCTVLRRFRRHYDEITYETGAFTHTDVTYIVTTVLDPDRRLESGATVDRVDAFRDQLTQEYARVIVDEAQDNSYGQLRAIRHLFDAGMTNTEGLYVGDLQQSIYTWRVAEPTLFAELIGVAGDPSGDRLGVDDVTTIPLTDSFRSHPHILDFVNDAFPDVFADPARGGLGELQVPFQELRARRVETEPDDPHVHVVTCEETSREDLVPTEATALARRLRGAVEEGVLGVDANRALAETSGDSVDRRTPAAGHEPAIEPATDGQIAFIFRSMWHADTYADALGRQGFKTAILSGTSLFETPEVQVVEGLLRCIERQNAPEGVKWLVDSPLSAIDDAAAEALDACGYDLHETETSLRSALAGVSDAAETVDSSLWDSPRRREAVEAAIDQVAALADLHRRLRTARHGPKADLLRTLVRETAYDATLLATENGFQRNANVDRLIEIVAGWEANEPLSLDDLLVNMARAREAEGDGPDAAVTADEYADDTVLLLSAHKAKGKEFDVVVLPDLYRQVGGMPMADADLLADRTTGMALRPWSGGATRPDPSPTTEHFDTFWQADETDAFDDVGHTWVAEHRADDGTFVHDHPYQGIVADLRAEEFRALYMAVTRACDHLVVGLAPNRTSFEEPYESWGATLEAALDLSNAPDRGAYWLDCTDSTDTTRSIPVGVDDLPAADPRPGRETTVAEYARRGRERQPTADATPDRPACPSAPEGDARTRPRTVSPSTITDQLDDVTAAFETICADVDVIARGSEIDAGDPPSGIDRQTWGDLVHAAVQALAADPSPGSHRDRFAAPIETALDAELLADHESRSAAHEILRSDVLPAFTATETYADLRDASPRLVERPTAAIFDECDRPLHVRGWFDLAYPTESGWRVCDLKTGAPAGSNPALAVDTDRVDEPFAGYAVQLGLYAWLLEHEYDVPVDTARLVYLWPTPVEIDLSFDRSRIPDVLAAIVEDTSPADYTDQRTSE